MDAFTLLTKVSDAYRSLESLAVVARVITESGDDDSSHRSQVRTTFQYSAPDRFRYQTGGRRGMVQVVDGTQIHTCQPRFAMYGGPRCHSRPIGGRPLPHVFQPDRPIGGGNEPFLYQAINEQVASAELLRDEDGCYVVAVTYPESPFRMFITRRPMQFWINSETLLVNKAMQEVGHRPPTEEEIDWKTYSVSAEKIEINPPLESETFVFVPPPDAVSSSGEHGFISGGGGGGFARFRENDPRHIEHRNSHTWEGETLVERSKWKVRGTTLDFERRLTFSDQDLQIVERAKSPAGAVETASSLRLKYG